MNNCICLVGNPNVGKTTLFNSLTHSNEHVGNWHGVTVDAKQKVILVDNIPYTVVDLPGTYSLSSFSYEEKVAVDFLLNNNNKIINICDANNLERNLYLTLQLLEADLDISLAINFCNETKDKFDLDVYKLSQLLSVSIYKINPKNKKETKQKLLTINKKNAKRILPYLDDIDTKYLQSLISPKCKELNLNSKFCAIKLLEQDLNILDKLNLSQEVLSKIKQHILSRPQEISNIAALRYQYIQDILSQAKHNKKDYVYCKYKIDKFILNKYFALPIFLMILAGVFYITFSSVGAYLGQFIKSLIDNFIGVPINNFFVKHNVSIWIIDLVNVCIINGVGGLLCFLPQVALLFMFLGVLEDSGYLSRLAFSLEDVFCKIGLSGKSLFTLLMGFGCATTATMTSRNLEDKNAKTKVALITPFMSCSAKLPIYAVLGITFFGESNILIIMGLYLLSFVVAFLVSSVLDKTILKNNQISFILEFAPYRMPSIKRIINNMYINCKQFLIKVGSLILSLSVIVWILQNFDFRFKYVITSNTKSMLQQICMLIAPLLAPIGLNNWGIVSCLVVGFVAKEMIISTLAIINNAPNVNNIVSGLGATFLVSTSVVQFTPLTSVVFMIFVLLYVPCLSTLSVLKQELGTKWAIFSVFMQLVIAYTVCLVVYNVGLLILHKNTLSSIIILLSFCLIIFSGVFCYKYLFVKNKKCSQNCLGCNKNCNKLKR